MLLSQLKYYQVVARHQHISRAAEELMVAQPAISATISKLEKELGVPLFERHGRNIVLNHAGERLLGHTEFIFEQIDQMKQALADTRDQIENTFVLSVNNTTLLKGWLQDFMLQYPRLRLQQRMLREDQMITALQDDIIDVAFGNFDADYPGIVREVIVDDEYTVAIPFENPLAQKEHIYFEDIRNQRVAALASNTIYRIADRLYAQKDCTPNIIFEGPYRMMQQALYRNNCILFDTKQMGYIKYLYIRPAEKEDFLYEKSCMRVIEDMEYKSSLCLCWKEGKELPHMANVFIESVRQNYPNYQNDLEYLNFIQSTNRE